VGSTSSKQRITCPGGGRCCCGAAAFLALATISTTRMDASMRTSASAVSGAPSDRADSCSMAPHARTPDSTMLGDRGCTRHTACRLAQWWLTGPRRATVVPPAGHQSRCTAQAACVAASPALPRLVLDLISATQRRHQCQWNRHQGFCGVILTCTAMLFRDDAPAHRTVGDSM
jgi:hypothetical protein